MSSRPDCRHVAANATAHATAEDCRAQGEALDVGRWHARLELGRRHGLGPGEGRKSTVHGRVLVAVEPEAQRTQTV